MNRISILCFLCSLSSTAFSQDNAMVLAPNTFTIQFNWNLGDTLEYAGSKEHKMIDANGKVTDSIIQAFALSLVVVDSTDSTYTIRVLQNVDWQNLTLVLSKKDIDEGELNTMMKGQECPFLEYYINKKGSFGGMKNLGPFVKSVTQVVHKLIDEKIKSKKGRKSTKQFLSGWLSPAVLQNKQIEDLIAMHRFFVYQYALDSIQIFDDEIPNVFSPVESLTMHNRLIASIPAEGWDGLISIQDSMIIDGKDAMTFVKGSYTEKNWVQLEDHFRKNQPRIEYNMQLVLYPENGLVYAMKYEQSNFIGNKLTYTYTCFIQLQEE